MRSAEAYLNHGRWVAECPEPGCHDARLAHRPDPHTGLPTAQRAEADVCANGHPFTIVMPPETLEAQIVAAVSERSHEADRSWYPRDHPTAILSGQPHGQTVQDLLDENRVVRKHWDAVASQKDDLLRQLLADRGVTVRADGTLEGNL